MQDRLRWFYETAVRENTTGNRKKGLTTNQGIDSFSGLDCFSGCFSRSTLAAGRHPRAPQVRFRTEVSLRPSAKLKPRRARGKGVELKPDGAGHPAEM